MFHVKLAAAIRASGHSIPQFAELLGVSSAYLYMICGGSREPSFETLRKIIQHLPPEVDLRELLLD